MQAILFWEVYGQRWSHFTSHRSRGSGWTSAVSTAVLWAGLGATVVALPIALGIHYIGRVALLGGSGERADGNLD